ncbi:MAG TPA: anaerobic ribonucleoside-triphosphate reductase activating protein [Deltaproteobacteria bacterium]|nr:anaerobic ribonucleoside-triphosphate reductase activating protein [Deltaproteobacteria bacterium]
MPKITDHAGMRIGYLQKTSLIEYPGKISAVVFTQGCNFRCPYCHNPELVDPSRFTPHLDIPDIFSFLEIRRGRCDAVTITGGEPCMQAGLLSFIKEVKEMGYLVKLDTNGSFPEVLFEATMSGLVDYIAMDVKAPLSRYEETVRITCDPAAVEESIGIVMRSGLPYEFRTTMVKGLLNLEDFKAIGCMIKGARHYILQRFVASKHLDERFAQAGSFSEEEISSIADILTRLVGRLSVR